MAEFSDRERQLQSLLTKLGPPRFNSVESYRAFCSTAAAEYGLIGGRSPDTPQFAHHLNKVNRGGELVITTQWGGVDIVKHKHPEVEKYLVVKGGRYLAFEMHEQKVETLTVAEGVGVLVFRPQNETDLRAELLNPGYTRTLQPRQEHTIIALSDLLIYETSQDPKGMDKDLIFIYEPSSP